jgi:hypothetical protein
MKRPAILTGKSDGFTMVEVLVSCIVFTIMVAAMISMQQSLRRSYTISRQYNEIYTVLSACPEVDRALEFDSISSTTNCYPNNSFPAEDGGIGTISYSPSLTVTDTGSLPSSDPLQSIPDSKVVDIQVGFPRPNTNLPTIELRMLITRNGIAQQ